METGRRRVKSVCFDFCPTNEGSSVIKTNRSEGSLLLYKIMCLLQNLMEQTLYTNLRIEQFNYTIEESPHFYTFWLPSCPRWLSENQNKHFLPTSTGFNVITLLSPTLFWTYVHDLFTRLNRFLNFLKMVIFIKYQFFL